jgi:hypothetical protein
MAVAESTKPSPRELPVGIRRKPGRPGYEAYVRAPDQRIVSRYFPVGSPLSEMKRWRNQTILELQHAEYLRMILMDSVPAPPRVDVGGYVYFLQNEQYVKIGKAADIGQRLSELQTAHPQTLRLVGVMYSPTPTTLEATIQKQFSALNIRGEWFLLTDGLRAWISLACHASVPRIE